MRPTAMFVTTMLCVPSVLADVQLAELLPMDGAAFDAIGSVVAFDGDSTVVVGASNADPAGDRSGAAWVFEKDLVTPGEWDESAKLVGFDGEELDLFGNSVSASGDIVAVGATGDGSGSVYVFERAHLGVPWGLRTKLTPSATGDCYGYVSLSGDTLAVGLCNGPGEVLIYERNHPTPDNWGEKASISVPVPGSIIPKLEGDTLAIGVLNEIPGGRVRIHYRNETGVDQWGFKAIIDPPFGIGGGFGPSADLSGDLLLVGAPLATIGGEVQQSIAYLFDRNESGPDQWGHVATFLHPDPPPDGVPFALFGVAVGLSCNSAAVSALISGEDEDTTGRVYVHAPDSLGNWQLVNSLAGLDSVEGDSFGSSLTLVDSVLAVGARGHDDIATGAGAAYIFGAPACAADLDNSGDVGFSDLLSVLSVWGVPCACDEDIDEDGSVGFGDLLAVLSTWGGCPCMGGVPTPNTLEQLLMDSGLTSAEAAVLEDCLENGTQAEQANCACWIRHYLEDCVPSCANLPDCPDGDPLSKH